MNTIINHKIIRAFITCAMAVILITGLVVITAEPAHAATKGYPILKNESKYCTVVLKDTKKPGYVKFYCQTGMGIKYSRPAKIVLRDKNNKWLCEWVAKDGDVFYLGNNHKEYRIYIKTTDGSVVRYDEWRITAKDNVTIS